MMRRQALARLLRSDQARQSGSLPEQWSRTGADAFFLRRFWNSLAGKLALKVIRARLSSSVDRAPTSPSAIDFSSPAFEIGPGELGLIAAANLEAAEFAREPRVTICTAGDELVMPGSTLRQGQSVDSASHSIAGLIRRWGGVPEASFGPAGRPPNHHFCPA